MYQLSSPAFDAFRRAPVRVHVGGSAGRYKEVDVPPEIRACKANVTMGSDRYWAQLDKARNKLGVYRLDEDKGWGNNLYVECNGDIPENAPDRLSSDIYIYIYTSVPARHGGPNDQSIRTTA